ncbi:hypothetical protein Dimus_005906, partial [Dionaea muscipula]
VWQLKPRRKKTVWQRVQVPSTTHTESEPVPIMVPPAPIILARDSDTGHTDSSHPPDNVPIETTQFIAHNLLESHNST